MRFSEHWLRTLVDPPVDTATLCDRLTMAGLEVEQTEAAAPAFTGVVVARIVSVDRHPEADRLSVCSVDIGARERVFIVCGAPNARAGLTVPCATVGAQLPGNVTIGRTTVRGVESQGMLCSSRELGIDDDASRLLELADGLAPGTDLREALALDDTLITLKLTPNRADCLSVLGIAREVAAMSRVPLRAPAIASAPLTTAASRRVRVEDPLACPRFASRMIEGIDARAPVPAWMKQRLARSGIRSISAVVDVTNYVMLELGQPMHAYDDRLLEGDVVVRFARSGEKLMLLNEQTLDLSADLLLVCDEKKPLGLAGIMGGEYSGIGDDTSAVFLEAAFWSPAVIQGKMRRLGFASDAGHRFERGVDFALPPAAIERATELILSICGGRAGPLGDVCGALPERTPVGVRRERITRLLGVELSIADIADAFVRLGLPFTRDGDQFVVTPPSYRFDLAIEEDFVEEVARIHGYDRIPAMPSPHPQHMLPQPESRLPLAAVKDRLVTRDYQEIVTFGFVSSEIEAAIGAEAGQLPIRVLNPIAAQHDVMRRSLLPGLLETLRTNVNRKETRARLFEVGRVYREARADVAVQPIRVGGLAFGDALPEQWGAKPSRTVDFFDVKGDLEALVHPRRVTTVAATHPALHPGRSARVLIEDVDAGWIGEIHPRLTRRFELPRAPVVFELDADTVAEKPMPSPGEVSRLPIVRRDVALVVDDATPAAALVSTMQAVAPPWVDTIRIFDVYRGPGLPSGRKSVAILVLMQDTARTLTDSDADQVVAALVREVAGRHGATLRTQDQR
jgi:phenylalanyl-tRNA synthetase beta chain